MPFIGADVTGKEPRELPETDARTAMGWEVYHEGLAEILAELRTGYGNPPVLVTEFGSAWTDALEPAADGTARVHDGRRVRYLRDALGAMHAALQAGSKLLGAFVWSLTDNSSGRRATPSASA